MTANAHAPRFRGALAASCKRGALAALALAMVAAANAPAAIDVPPRRSAAIAGARPLLGVVDAGRWQNVATLSGVGWDRLLFLWANIQPSEPEDWQLDAYLDRQRLRPSLNSGLSLTAVVHATPDWAATNPDQHSASVPSGLEYPADDPRNTFGTFLLRLVGSLKGRVHSWVIWNEPDFQPGDSGAWWTWMGSSADMARLLRTAYTAVKMADPDAQVVFPATSYFVDAVNGRELYLARVLHELARDPAASANGFYFDAVALNLYCSPEAIYRVAALYREALARYRLAQPIWLTETNCPVYNDATTPAKPQAHISTSEQAAYVVQAIAMARAAGYERVGWYGMVDHEPSSGIVDRWGLLRRDGTARPAFDAFAMARDYLGSPSQVATFAPGGNALPRDGWPVWRVSLDDPAASQRVQVLWRSRAGPERVRLEAETNDAYVLDVLGRRSTPDRSGVWWNLPLPPARVVQPYDPPGFPLVGDPVLLVEPGLRQQRSDLPPVLVW